MFNSLPAIFSCKRYLNTAFLVLFFAISFSSHAREWYEGGTLHDATALEWQNASYENKLATSADLIAKLYNDGKLSPKVSSHMKNMNNFRALSDELTKQMDDALKPLQDKKQNEKIYKNQSVVSIAVMSMIKMGWVSI